MTHKAKKSLGQHFLRSTSAVRAIVAGGQVAPEDTVLEIGPGEGVLTRALLDTGAHVIAVEKDTDLIPILQQTFSSEIASKQFELLHDDALTFNPSSKKLRAGEYKLVANIPYYITGALFEKFLTEKNHPSVLVFLIQKEVATRIVARDKKESILSISVKAFGSPKLTTKVPASAFKPAPKVDSAVLVVNDITRERFAGWNISEEKAIEHFFKIVRAGFAHKRKLLIRNLEEVASKEKIARAFDVLKLSEKTRAEDLAPAIWFSLAQALL